MFPEELLTDAAALLAQCREANLTLATAESCTGGLIIGLLTDIAGSSDVVDRGFITYSNTAKHEMLGVDMALILAHGAVSEPVARAMAAGARAKSKVGMALSVTGIAGPGGGTSMKPVGLVYIALAYDAEIRVEEHHFKGTRQEIRLAAVKAALRLGLNAVKR